MNSKNPNLKKNIFTNRQSPNLENEREGGGGGGG